MMTLKIHWQILIALLLAVIVGSLSSPETTLLGIPLVSTFDFIGTLFLNALKMLIVPLIVSSMISGMYAIGNGGQLGGLASKTILYYLSTTLFAVLVGITLVNVTAPGIIDGQPAKDIIGLQADTSAVTAKIQDHDSSALIEIFERMIPTNIIQAASQGDMLALIFFSLVFGYFAATYQGAHYESMRAFWQGSFEIMMRVTNWVMRFAPIGVFALVAKVVASTGLAAIEPLLLFMFTVLAGLAIHMLVTLPLLLWLVAGVSPIQHYRAMTPALLTAFSTASSSATLPVTMDCLERRAGVSNRVSSFVLPLGATINMDGTALYECVAVVFIAQAYGVELSLATQITIVLLALLSSIGVAGIPAASLVAIVIILHSVGLPAEGIGLLLAVDRILDMCRTSTNVFSDSCGAVVVARLEGEKGVLNK